MHVDGAALAAEVHAPHLLHQLVSGKGRTHVGQEQPQQLELLVRQLHPHAVSGDGVLLVSTARLPQRSTCCCTGLHRRSTALTRDTSSMTPKGLVR